MIYRASRLLLIITLIAIGYEYPSATGKQVMDELRPEKAVEGIIKLFDRFPIVALGEMLWNRTQHDFIVSLIEHPGFPDKVNDIVVEFGSARYLYLGPRDSLVMDTVPPEVERDEEYKRELDRRKKLLQNQD
jgi:hypothetical protein